MRKGGAGRPIITFTLASRSAAAMLTDLRSAPAATSLIFQYRMLMTLPRLTVTLTLLLAGTALAADESKPVKVFLFAGQSNMVGSDAHSERIDDYPMFKGAGVPQDDVLFARLPEKDQSAPAAWGPLQPMDAFGPEITFARMVKAHDDSPIAIIKSAIGGTTAAFDWNPDAPEKGQKLYPRTIKLVQESLTV